jgi:hypothetical protein
MNEELRDAIGRAAYEVLDEALEEENDMDGDYDWDKLFPWDKLSEDAKEVNRKCGEAAVQAFLAPLMPTISTLAQELIKNNPSMESMMREVVRQAIGKELDV